MAERYLCKIASLEEMNAKWDYEIAHKVKDRENWVIWKREHLERFRRGWILPYYGILDGQIICEATANIRPEAVQNSEGLVDEKTVNALSESVTQYKDDSTAYGSTRDVHRISSQIICRCLNCNSKFIHNDVVHYVDPWKEIK